MDAGCWNFDGATQLPSKFSLVRKPMKAVSSTPRKEGVLYDFGKETFGYITLKDVKGKERSISITVKVLKKPWIRNIAKHWTNCWQSRGK